MSTLNYFLVHRERDHLMEFSFGGELRDAVPDLVFDILTKVIPQVMVMSLKFVMVKRIPRLWGHSKTFLQERHQL